MRMLYLDCGMGAAGDMLAAALLELLDDRESFLREFNALGIPGVCAAIEPSEKCGIMGTHFSVRIHGMQEEEHTHEHPHEHEHRHGTMSEIRHIVGRLPVDAEVRRDILEVYESIAAAESRVHGVPVEQIHFHEVGSMDAVADVTAVCLLMHRLSPDRVLASPVHVGSGSVRCAHGILPVPAPATAELLRGVPICGGEISGELCTPTGAALLKHFVSDFRELPALRLEAVGYGMGKKDFARANCVRALLGETQEQAQEVLELRCNLDDMSGEAIGLALDRLLEAGALDVFTLPIGMKKSRPGVLLTVLCRPEDREALIRALFRHTTTLGVRETLCGRTVLTRRMETVQTAFGPVRRKLAEGFGIRRTKYEYDDLARIAHASGLALDELLRRLPPDEC